MNLIFILFTLQYRKGGASAWVYFIDQKIPSDATSFIMRNLSADSSYLIKLAAQNEFGMGEFDQYHSAVQTLKVRLCFYRTILKIKFTGQIYRYFLWL